MDWVGSDEKLTIIEGWLHSSSSWEKLVCNEHRSFADQMLSEVLLNPVVHRVNEGAVIEADSLFFIN